MPRSIRMFLLLASIVWLAASPARAGVVITISQEGLSVVSSGSGTIDTTDLTQTGVNYQTGTMIPMYGAVVEGTPTNSPSTTYDAYTTTTGPGTFGAGGQAYATTGSGDFFGTGGNDTIYLPVGYVSGTELSGTDTYAGQSLTTLGLVAGTYTWTWGTGAHADSLTVNIVAAVVPEPSSAIMAASGAVALVACSWYRRRRHQRRPLSA